MLAKRISGAAILIPVVAAAVYLGGLPLLGLTTIAAVLAGIECFRLVDCDRVSPSLVIGLVAIVAYIVDAQWPSLGLLPWVLILSSLIGLTIQVFRRNAPGSLHRWALIVAGSLYIGFSVGHFVKLRALDAGVYWVVLALVSTWICDSAAYFVGSAIGKHKLSPSISPKKTWEGAIAGLIFGVATVVLLGCWLLDLDLPRSIALGALLVLAATIGDLAESVIKRQVGVKDSGRLIPGHGGMLDRIDSLLFVVPIVYYFVITFVSSGAYPG